MSKELENMQKQNILIYQNDLGNVKVDVMFEDETIWLSQSQICELYGKAKSTISEHITDIFQDRELHRDSTVRNYRTVQIEGTREVSKFRIWAMISLKELEEDIKRYM
jgi:hypothetical protein